jgi:monolysocardiolipin acyltransferase
VRTRFTKQHAILLQVHTFPEGKIQQELGPLPRLKWGIGSLIARAVTSPIVLPVCHSGFEQVGMFNM